MAAPPRRPRLALWVLMLGLTKLFSLAASAHLKKTSGGSREEMLLPDEQVAFVLFRIAEAGEKTQNEEEGTKSKGNNPASGREEERGEDDEDTTLDTGRKQRSVSLRDGDISLTYFVYPLQRVYIPAANLSRRQLPPSWWGRKVVVSSEPPVYWRLCHSLHDCEGPPHALHNTTASGTPTGDPELDRILVIVLGATCGTLLLLCLALTALVRHLRKRPPTHPVRIDTIDAHQFTTRM
ncbi:hypothetical protein GWK47_023309 [Chionoecetes opilio]|uniref:Uncharacterized protein n=1 Tax=Chionoecetes opilio TaxID=41210 RepID=A0A8J4XRC8_CHIOP|nr:hypothetical protein GWK47_023309 [Chionoecetes opilio]